MATASATQAPFTWEGTDRTGKKIKGSWNLPEDSESGMLEGDLEFEIAKKKD